MRDVKPQKAHSNGGPTDITRTTRVLSLIDLDCLPNPTRYTPTGTKHASFSVASSSSLLGLLPCRPFPAVHQVREASWLPLPTDDDDDATA